MRMRTPPPKPKAAPPPGKVDRENKQLRQENERLRSAIELVSKELESHTTAAVMNAEYVQSCYAAFEELCEEQKKTLQDLTKAVQAIEQRLNKLELPKGA